jgi:hypothetical protein
LSRVPLRKKKKGLKPWAHRWWIQVLIFFSS